jgi:hypothetical protein
MKLTKEQQEKASEKLKPFFNRPCSCSGQNWILNDKIFELREFNEGNLVIGGKNSSIFPVISVSCSKCGNTHFFNAILLGLIQKDNESK